MKLDLSMIQDAKTWYALSLILSGFDGVLCFIIVIILLFMKKQQKRNLAASCSSSGLAFTNVGEPQVYLAYGMQEMSTAL
jgi:hypothetical protein